MSPLPLLPRGVQVWHRSDPAGASTGKNREVLSDEELSDYLASRSHQFSLTRTFLALTVLSISAVVVILPFLYMVLISFKGPAEVGNGHLLPAAIHAFSSPQKTWVILRLNAQQNAQLSDLQVVPVLPAGDAPFSPWPEPRDLPSGTLTARCIEQKKESRYSNYFQVTLALEDTNRRIGAEDPVAVFLPNDSSRKTWIQYEGTALFRRNSMIFDKLFNNYKTLIKWEELVAGNLLSWISSGYPRWYINSLFVAVCTMLLGVFLDSLAAFAFAKMTFPFQRQLFTLLILTLMIPYPVTLVPTFFIFAQFGLYNTYAALIIPGIVSAFGIFLVRQYMENVPNDMLDAARVDGASDFQVYRFVVFPACRPVLAALAVFRFIYQWNTYLYPLVLTNRDGMKTIQLGIATMEDLHGTIDYGHQMAGSTLAVIPILIVYGFMQKHFISGLTMGSAKG